MIGAPVTSVRTPPLLEAFLRDNGRAATVEVLHVEPEDLDAAMADIRADASVLGLMVTMPHKQTAALHCDKRSSVSHAVGAVNAIKRVGDKLYGAQFDGTGLCNALISHGADLQNARIWLAGVGGAGLAIAHTLSNLGCRTLMVSDPDPRRLEALSRVAPLARPLAPGEIAPADILINATPLGMKDGDPSPFPQKAIHAAAQVADIVAVPNRTQLFELARAEGISLVSGLEMVEHQIAPIGRWLLSEHVEQYG